MTPEQFPSTLPDELKNVQPSLSGVLIAEKMELDRLRQMRKECIAVEVYIHEYLARTGLTIEDVQLVYRNDMEATTIRHHYYLERRDAHD